MSIVLKHVLGQTKWSKAVLEQMSGFCSGDREKGGKSTSFVPEYVLAQTNLQNLFSNSCAHFVLEQFVLCSRIYSRTKIPLPNCSITSFLLKCLLEHVLEGILE